MIKDVKSRYDHLLVETGAMRDQVGLEKDVNTNKDELIAMLQHQVRITPRVLSRNAGGVHELPCSLERSQEVLLRQIDWTVNGAGGTNAAASPAAEQGCGKVSTSSW